MLPIPRTYGNPQPIERCWVPYVIFQLDSYLSTWFPGEKEPFKTGKRDLINTPRDIFQVYILGWLLGPPIPKGPQHFSFHDHCFGSFLDVIFSPLEGTKCVALPWGEDATHQFEENVEKPNLGGHLCSGEFICTRIFDSEPVEPNLLKCNNWPPTSYKYSRVFKLLVSTTAIHHVLRPLIWGHFSPFFFQIAKRALPLCSALPNPPNSHLRHSYGDDDPKHPWKARCVIMRCFEISSGPESWGERSKKGPKKSWLLINIFFCRCGLFYKPIEGFL